MLQVVFRLIVVDQSNLADDAFVHDSLGCMAHRFNVVSFHVNDKCAVIVGVVVRPSAEHLGGHELLMAARSWLTTAGRPRTRPAATCNSCCRPCP